MATAIAINGVSMEYKTPKGTTHVLDNVSYEVQDGHFVSIVGPSGVGKTTLLRLLTGLAKPNSINKALIRAGVRLRGKRNDTAALHSADGLIGLSLKGEPVKPAAEPVKPEPVDGEDPEGGDETAGSGHTVATLAALLASLPEALVTAAVTASQARRLIRAAA